jgi:hypothetical protein
MAVNVGGNNSESGKDILVDNGGTIYLTGYYLQTTDFDPGLGTYNLTAVGSADIFIAKYSQTIILPVSLVNFSASLTFNKDVKLDWQTTSEQNASEFIIERSADGTNFKSIGTLPAEGNSVAIKNYSFIDGDPKLVNIYRLRIIDADGKMQYSKTILVKLGETTQTIKIFPNPVTDVLQLQTKMKGNLSIRIYDVKGQLVKTVQAMNSGLYLSTTMDVDGLSKGIYHLEVTNGSEVERIRFIK